MEKIKKASVRLILNEPFWGSILLECNKIPSEMVPTIGVFPDGTIVYNEKFIEALSIEEVQGLLAHEVCHLVLNHLIRAEDKDKTKWNIATDLATNSILLANGFALPKGGCFPKEFDLLEGKAAEWYYEKLNQIQAQKAQGIDKHFCEPFEGEKQESQEQQGEQRQQDKKDQDSQKEKGKEGDKGEGENNEERKNEKGEEGKGEGNNEEKGKKKKGKGKGEGKEKEKGKEKEVGKDKGEEDGNAEAEGDKKENGEKGNGKERKGGKIDIKKITKKWEDVLTRAVTTARMQGKLPAGLQEIISDIFNPRIPWRSILRDFLSGCIRGGEDWSRPNRQYIWRNIYLPSSKEKRLEVVIAVDTSGSISSEELKIFFSEVNGIIQAVGKYRIWLLQCDADIQEIQEIEYPEEIDTGRIKVKGRGGTDFRPVFEWMRENELTHIPLIYFTDLEGTFPEKEPIFPVLWVNIGREITVPFGKIIKLERGIDRW